MQSGSRLFDLLVSILRGFAASLGAVIVLFEELLWQVLGLAMKRLSRLALIERLEHMVSALPPYPAMALFLVPVLLILPIKLGAVWMISHGHIVGGITILLSAKIGGMAVWARLYALCHPALLQVRWFAALESTLLRWRAWAHDWLHQIPLYRALRATLLWIRRRCHNWGRRLIAALRA